MAEQVIERLRLALSQTKFKNTPNLKMYYYGTEKEAEAFRVELKNLARNSQ